MYKEWKDMNFLYMDKTGAWIFLKEINSKYRYIKLLNIKFPFINKYLPIKINARMSDTPLAYS